MTRTGRWVRLCTLCSHRARQDARKSSDAALLDGANHHGRWLLPRPEVPIRGGRTVMFSQQEDGSTSTVAPSTPRSGGQMNARTLDVGLLAGLDEEHSQHRRAPAPDRASVGYLRAWMLVLPTDVAALLAPGPFGLLDISVLAVVVPLTVLLLASGGLYHSRLHLSILDEAPGIMGRFLVAAAVVAFVVALRHGSLVNLDGLLRALALMLVMLLAGRGVTAGTIMIGRRRRMVRRRAIVIGSGPVTAHIAGVLARCPQYGLRVVGFVDNPHRPDRAVHDLPHLGDLDHLSAAMRRGKADVVIVADADIHERRIVGLLREAMAATHDILVVPRMHQLQTHLARQDRIGEIPIVHIRPPRLNGWRWIVKRLGDVAFSALALLALSPVLAACALAVRIEGGPGVFFRQQRVGQHGRLFEVLKFRSLRPTDEAESQTTWSVANDSRVGPVGRFLRCTSLDELPQLWNILRGDMTLVGPRPERPHFVKIFSAEHTHYSWRHRAPAGLTGLAQVSGLRGDTSISDRARFDNYYIENWSLWLDFKILLWTMREVLVGGGR